MSSKQFLVAVNDGDITATVSARMVRALDGAMLPARRPVRCFLVDGELVPVSMPADIWSALDDIAQTEGLMTANLVEQIAKRRHPSQTLPAAIRTFILAFMRRS